MQKPNNAGLLAQDFLKLALLLQAGEKVKVFNQAQQEHFESIIADFRPIKIRIQDATFDATIQKAAEIKGDPIAELEAALAIDPDINDSFWDVGIDADAVIDEIKAGTSKNGIDI